MTVKWIGAILIVCACGGFGFHLAAAQKREEAILRELMSVLEYFSCELQCRLTPLPLMCHQAAQNCSGQLAKIMELFAQELDMQRSSNPAYCMASVLSKSQGLTENTVQLMRRFGSSLGHFDLSGQQKEISALHSLCAEQLKKLTENKDTRYRTYQTLGLCAGAALAILFI